MVLRQLFVVLVVMSLGWLLRRLFGAVSAGSDPRGPARVPPREPGAEMVRDRVCNTFLPRSSALTSQVAGEEHFFCSESCRQTFLSGS